MMRSVSNLACALALLCAAVGCSNNSPITPNGGYASSTLSCMVDDGDWSPSTLQSGVEDITTSYSNEYLQIVAYRQPTSSDRTIIEIDLDGITQPGQFDLGATGSRALFVNENLISQDQIYSTNSNYSGTVDISRFDTLLREVSGTFSFEAENQANNFVSVRSGSFDLYY